MERVPAFDCLWRKMASSLKNPNFSIRATSNQEFDQSKTKLFGENASHNTRFPRPEIPSFHPVISCLMFSGCVPVLDCQV